MLQNYEWRSYVSLRIVLNNVTKIQWPGFWNFIQKIKGHFHSMATANLNKSEDFVTNTTAVSKYIPVRPRISINWNPTFQTSLYKILKVILFRLRIFFFMNKKLFSKEQLVFSFLSIVKQKKIRRDLKNFENFWFSKITK